MSKYIIVEKRTGKYCKPYPDNFTQDIKEAFLYPEEDIQIIKAWPEIWEVSLLPEIII